ncbi:hypothetical protein IFR05_017348, partial [Cadophora sp. M221]
MGRPKVKDVVLGFAERPSFTYTPSCGSQLFLDLPWPGQIANLGMLLVPVHT